MAYFLRQIRSGVDDAQSNVPGRERDAMRLKLVKGRHKVRRDKGFPSENSLGNHLGAVPLYVYLSQARTIFSFGRTNLPKLATQLLGQLTGQAMSIGPDLMLDILTTATQVDRVKIML